MPKNILIVGGGGREHALAWKLRQSPKVGKIFIAPGNAGTAQVGENVAIAATDISGLAKFAKENQVDLTVVGQDDPLALGIADEFQKRGLRIWGPSKAATRIEASKAFAKELMKKQNIPTAEFKIFDDYSEALNYIENHFSSSPHLRGGAREGWQKDNNISPLPNLPHQGGGEFKPIVIKASGLALGKGVSVCKTLAEAKNALKNAMVNKIFGAAGQQVVIEEFLQGQEFSVHAFCDGKTFQMLPAAQDHKPIFDENKGPNTGGMGTIAPVPWVNAKLMDQVSEEIIKPILRGLTKNHSPFAGLLYPGLIQTANGPKVIEFNARFGDPETQSLMRLMKSDLLDVLEASVDGQLNKINIEWEKKFACCIVAASGGYPGKYEKNKTITGIAEAEKIEDVIVFHAGTKINPPSPPLAKGGNKGGLATNGGRVLGITATADDLKTALNKAYTAIKLIHFDGMHYRADIGLKSLNF